MKITIPMNEQELESGVCPSFGRAPYFLLYDTNTNESKWIANSAAESGADALITPRCGENAEKAAWGNPRSAPCWQLRCSGWDTRSAY